MSRLKSRNSYLLVLDGSQAVILKNKLVNAQRNLFVDKDSVQFSSVAQSCPTLCDPMNRSRPGLPVHHQLPEFTQTQAHWVGDAIQPSHPLSSPSPPAPNPSQHQGLFQCVNSYLANSKLVHGPEALPSSGNLRNTESQGPPRALLNRTCIWQNPQVNHTHIIVCRILSNFA